VISVRSVLWRRFAIAAIAAAAAASCGGSGPVAPSAPQVAGAWIADSTLLAVSGGECAGVTLQNAVGRRDVFLSALAGLSTIAATITSEGNGTSCAYAGTNAAGAVNLKMTSCAQNKVFTVACSGGDRRDLRLAGGSLTANADSRLGTGSGSDVTTWDVFQAGTAQRVGTLTLTAGFNWIFLGLPASNYHEFTGNVFPGYEDGTITIPDDPNPWCRTCGWFQ
jgi:hypothetical protein